MTKKVPVGIVQMRMTPDADTNMQTALDGIRDAAKKGAALVCLPELFRSQYFCQVEDAALFDLAEAVPGPSTEKIAALARELKVVVVASLFERRTAGVYHNTSVVIETDGSIAGKYRKMHIPDDPSYYEKFYFTPGDLGFQSFDTSAGHVGTLVCWDQWFPEGARLTSLKGAEILVYPTAIGWLSEDKPTLGESQLDAWRTIQRSHAIANGVFVVAVNRIGHEGDKGAGIEFWGNSFVVDPAGRVIAEASRTEPETMVVECDLGSMETVRRGWPFLRDRRIDAYAPLTRRLIDES